MPFTILLGLSWYIWEGATPLSSLAVHGIGSLALALYSHHLYVQRNFVERGDAALAWSVAAWSVALVPMASPSEGAQTWFSLLLLCGSLDQTLRIHRQPSTSSIQFRASLFAGIAVGIQPLNVGIVLGLIAVQLRSRPSILREWALLILGFAHGFLISEIGWHFMPNSGLPDVSSSNQMATATAFHGHWTHGAMITAGAVGLLMLRRENPRLILKMKNARFHAILMLLCLLGTASAMHSLDLKEFLPTRTAGYTGYHWSAIAAWGLGFVCLGLIPKRERRTDKTNALDTGAWLLFVGTLLVVFGLRFIH